MSFFRKLFSSWFDSNDHQLNAELQPIEPILSNDELETSKSKKRLQKFSNLNDNTAKNKTISDQQPPIETENPTNLTNLESSNINNNHQENEPDDFQTFLNDIQNPSNQSISFTKKTYSSDSVDSTLEFQNLTISSETKDTSNSKQTSRFKFDFQKSPDSSKTDEINSKKSPDFFNEFPTASESSVTIESTTNFAQLPSFKFESDMLPDSPTTAQENSDKSPDYKIYFPVLSNSTKTTKAEQINSEKSPDIKIEFHDLDDSQKMNQSSFTEQNDLNFNFQHQPNSSSKTEKEKDFVIFTESKNKLPDFQITNLEKPKDSQIDFQNIPDIKLAPENSKEFAMFTVSANNSPDFKIESSTEQKDKVKFNFQEFPDSATKSIVTNSSKLTGFNINFPDLQSPKENSGKASDSQTINSVESKVSKNVLNILPKSSTSTKEFANSADSSKKTSNFQTANSVKMKNTKLESKQIHDSLPAKENERNIAAFIEQVNRPINLQISKDILKQEESKTDQSDNFELSQATTTNFTNSTEKLPKLSDLLSSSKEENTDDSRDSPQQLPKFSDLISQQLKSNDSKLKLQNIPEPQMTNSSFITSKFAKKSSRDANSAFEFQNILEPVTNANSPKNFDFTDSTNKLPNFQNANSIKSKDTKNEFQQIYDSPSQKENERNYVSFIESVDKHPNLKISKDILKQEESKIDQSDNFELSQATSTNFTNSTEKLPKLSDLLSSSKEENKDDSRDSPQQLPKFSDLISQQFNTTDSSLSKEETQKLPKFSDLIKMNDLDSNNSELNISSSKEKSSRFTPDNHGDLSSSKIQKKNLAFGFPKGMLHPISSDSDY